MYTYHILASIKDSVTIYDELKVKREDNKGNGAIFGVYNIQDKEERLIYRGMANDTADFLNSYFKD